MGSRGRVPFSMVHPRIKMCFSELAAHCDNQGELEKAFRGLCKRGYECSEAFEAAQYLVKRKLISRVALRRLRDIAFELTS